MKDEKKTKAELIEELAEMRQRVVDVEAGEKRQQVLSRVRDEVWKMENADDIRNVVTAVGKGLEMLGVPFQACDINLVDASSDPPTVNYHTLLESGGWREGEEKKGRDTLLRIWKDGKVAYRRDLTVEDVYQERTYLEEQFGVPTCSVVDVPFAFGTLAVNSSEANAFSKPHIRDLQALVEVLSEGFLRLGDMQKLEERNQELEEKTRNLDAFQRIGKVILDFADMESMANPLSEQVVKVGLFRSLIVAIVNPGSGPVGYVKSI